MNAKYNTNKNFRHIKTKRREIFTESSFLINNCHQKRSQLYNPVVIYKDIYILMYSQ